MSEGIRNPKGMTQQDANAIREWIFGSTQENFLKVLRENPEAVEIVKTLETDKARQEGVSPDEVVEHALFKATRGFAGLREEEFEALVNTTKMPSIANAEKYSDEYIKHIKRIFAERPVEVLKNAGYQRFKEIRDDIFPEMTEAYWKKADAVDLATRKRITGHDTSGHSTWAQAVSGQQPEEGKGASPSR